MRSLILLHHLSLDGFVARPKGELDWVAHDDEIWSDVNALRGRCDAAVFGRINFEGFRSYWPTVKSDPSASANDRDFADWIEKVPKVVLSTTLVDPVWTNARVVSSDVTKAIGALKAEAGKDILSFGGPAANASLLGLGLIDELRLYVNPLLLGRGLPLFPKASPPLRLTLTAERRFSSGVVSLHYKKRVD